MHEYDTALKTLLQRLHPDMLRQVTGFAVTRWHNVELADVKAPRVDLLGETDEGRLVHIELQSTNDPKMGWRMAEYCLIICKLFARVPDQVVLYVGEPRLKMNARLNGPHLNFECGIVDIRDLDGEAWLSSEQVEGNIVSILMPFANQRAAVQKILSRIACCEPHRRPGLLAELLVLSGLRESEDIIKSEAKQMPILNDIMDHKVLGPLLRDAHTEGKRAVVLEQLSEQFGIVPESVRSRIEGMSLSDVNRIAVRLLRAGSLEDALR